MPLRPAGVLICTLGVAVMLASAADATVKKTPPHAAATHARANHPRVGHPHVSHAGADCRRPDLFPCGPITYSNVYLGEDPDPFIRSMIQRDPGAVLGDPN